MRRFTVIAVTLLLTVTTYMSAGAAPFAADLAFPPVTGPFERTWQRTDEPVAGNAATRTWIWGPQGITSTMLEPYADSPDGLREVIYFDKARMEINDPGGPRDSAWYVTTGLLAVELITGQMQTGMTSYENRQPAQVNVAGDPEDTTGPTYATFLGLLGAQPLANGSVITQRIDRAGSVSNDATLASFGVTASHLIDVPGLRHQIASPFWAFMNSSGTVFEEGRNVSGPLFGDPFYAIGYPVTEAYWSDVRVDGDIRTVLVQCFQRRCLTYAPQNPSEWQVEMGNVGQHYYKWRYGTDLPALPPSVEMPGGYDPVGASPLIDWGVDLGGQSEISVANQSPHGMSVTFDGPTSYTMTIPPCTDCSVYPSDAAFAGCRPDIPYETATLPTGTYRVRITWTDPGVMPSAGPWTLTPNSAYGVCWYVVAG